MFSKIIQGVRPHDISRRYVISKADLDALMRDLVFTKFQVLNIYFSYNLLPGRP